MMKPPPFSWVLVVLLAAMLVGQGLGRRDTVARAEAAEDSLAVLRPVVDSLVTLAARRDTVLQLVTDTVRVVVERTRVVQVAVGDTLRASLDSAQAVLFDTLLAAHADEVAALERLNAETLLWGRSWQEAAGALRAENEQLRLRGDAWEAAYAARGRRSWVERGAVVLATAGVLLLR